MMFFIFISGLPAYFVEATAVGLLQYALAAQALIAYPSPVATRESEYLLPAGAG
jgi:hypothetical protein